MSSHIILAYDSESKRETLVNIEFYDFNECVSFCTRLNSQQSRYIFSSFEVISKQPSIINIRMVQKLTDLEGIEYASI